MIFVAHEISHEIRVILDLEHFSSLSPSRWLIVRYHYSTDMCLASSFELALRPLVLAR